MFQGCLWDGLIKFQVWSSIDSPILAQLLFPLLPLPTPLQVHHTRRVSKQHILVLQNHQQKDGAVLHGKNAASPATVSISCYRGLHPNVSQEKHASQFGVAAPSSLAFRKKPMKFDTKRLWRRLRSLLPPHPVLKPLPSKSDSLLQG